MKNPTSADVANNNSNARSSSKRKVFTSSTPSLVLQKQELQQQQHLHNALRPTTAHINKPSKRSSKNDIHYQDRSNSDSLPDSSSTSGIGNEYRALRRKYLLLEEESFGLGTELKVVEDEVKTLEDEKLALLDQLVVLEGLIHPSQIHPNSL